MPPSVRNSTGLNVPASEPGQDGLGSVGESGVQLSCQRLAEVLLGLVALAFELALQPQEIMRQGGLFRGAALAQLLQNFDRLRSGPLRFGGVAALFEKPGGDGERMG